MATWYHSTVTLLHVSPLMPVAAYAPGSDMPPYAGLTAEARQELAASLQHFAEREAGTSTPISVEIAEGHTASTIVARASELHAKG
jgi:hypothetical protein